MYSYPFATGNIDQLFCKMFAIGSSHCIRCCPKVLNIRNTGNFEKHFHIDHPSVMTSARFGFCLPDQKLAEYLVFYPDQALLAGIQSRVLFILVWCKNISAIDQIQRSDGIVLEDITEVRRSLATARGHQGH